MHSTPGIPLGGRPGTAPRRRGARAAALALALLAAPVACGDDSGDDTGAGGTASTGADAAGTTAPAAEPVIDPGDGGRYEPQVDPADFVDAIDNPYLPLVPGTSWTYEGLDDGEQQHNEVVVTDERRTVMGISAVVVRDTVSVDGEVIEETDDWYAQDRDGNVWYLGEATTAYEDGETTTEGSWEAGVDGGLPGVVMPADPAVGDAYRQEYLEGEAEDMAEVVTVGATAEVTAGRYDDVVVIREWTPLEPEVVEEKRYAPGVGQLDERKTAGGTGGLELVETTEA
jgi:hypothetical protein